MKNDEAGRIVNNEIHSRGLWADAWHRLKKNKLAVGGLTFIGILILISIATIIIDWVTKGSVYQNYVVQTNLSMKLMPPSSKHIFGCDEYGRDILFRIIWGTRYSLSIGVVSIAMALFLGGILGSVAGFYGGTIDNIIMRVMDVFLSIPSMVMAIAIVSALGNGTFNILLSIAVPQVPRLARIVRASIISVRDKEFVEAARAVGASDFLIIVKYIIPNALAPIIVQASLNVGSAILSVAGLSFLGIGIQPPAPEWGSILNAARTYMRNSWHISVIPGFVIMLTVLCINLAGDGLRDALDPKLKN